LILRLETSGDAAGRLASTSKSGRSMQRLHGFRNRLVTAGRR
jgi:hypothetical protein